MKPRCFHPFVLLTLAGLLPILGGAGRAAPDAEPQGLFNGKDLSGFSTYLGAPKPGAKPYGKDNDPEKVFTVEGGMIHVTGKVYGSLVTAKEYADYRLRLEYKWGEKTWPPREDKARTSAVQVHCTGPDSAGDAPWMEGLACLLQEGGTGTLVPVRGKTPPSLTATAVQKPGGEGQQRRQGFYYLPGAPPQPVAGPVYWFGRDPDWKDVKGYRGQKPLEARVGEWNRLECVCAGDKVTVVLNGVTINACSGVRPAKGKILLRSEGAEVFFRKLDLEPLPKK